MRGEQIFEERAAAMAVATDIDELGQSGPRAALARSQARAYVISPAKARSLAQRTKPAANCEPRP